jgi:phosphoribosyl-ATP pyrophosphohydrolase/phosphoribosyl-AMP cyclohydrolase/histidinol dehydrogenase
LGRATCWGEASGLERLEKTIEDRLAHPVAASYTDRLVNEGGLLPSKLREEARELSEAQERLHVVAETADVTFFAAVKLAASGARWQDVFDELDRRSLKITRRPGNAKTKELE